MKIKPSKARREKRTKIPPQVLIIMTIVLLALVASQIMVMRAQNPHDQNKVDESYPIVDYSASLPVDSESRSRREKANRSYDRYRMVTKDPIGTEVSLMNDSLSDIPALPVHGSSAVVLGTVSDPQAFLSNDKTAVYSEFTLQVERIFKDDKDAPLNVGNAIKVDRLGGRVRHSTNKTVWYHVSGQSMPQSDKKYIFFLRRHPEGENYSIVTGYELASGHVHPLDKTSAFAGAAYDNAEEQSFLEKLQEAIGIALATPKP